STTISIAAYWYTNELKAVVERQGFKPSFLVTSKVAELLDNTLSRLYISPLKAEYISLPLIYDPPIMGALRITTRKQ
ncbi:hypothetical protein, partial [Nodularia chucula]|uniref:hypothetical protein n=1 Tax=Nodularia chucula TaxID=3093667 RepID=UPI0039C5E579